MLTLVITAPDGTETRNNPVQHAPQLARAVAVILRGAAPWLTPRETRSLGLQVAQGEPGLTRVHAATGYRFRIETEEN